MKEKVRIYKISESIWRKLFNGSYLGKMYSFNSFLILDDDIFMITNDVKEIIPEFLFVESSNNRPYLAFGCLIKNSEFLRILKSDERRFMNDDIVRSYSTWKFLAGLKEFCGRDYSSQIWESCYYKYLIYLIQEK